MVTDIVESLFTIFSANFMFKSKEDAESLGHVYRKVSPWLAGFFFPFNWITDQKNYSISGLSVIVLVPLLHLLSMTTPCAYLQVHYSNGLELTQSILHGFA